MRHAEYTSYEERKNDIQCRVVGKKVREKINPMWACDDDGCLVISWPEEHYRHQLQEPGCGDQEEYSRTLLYTILQYKEQGSENVYFNMSTCTCAGH